MFTVMALVSYSAATTVIRGATGRALGTIVASHDAQVVVRWTPRDGAQRDDVVALAGTAPAPGTRTEVAYDPARPSPPLVPGAAVLAAADRAVSTVALIAAIMIVVVGAGGWQLVSRRRAADRPGHRAAARRMRVQSGLSTRSYLETESAPQRWIPVHFDPVLVGLASPTTVLLHGDPLRDRLVVASVDGHVLWPSGPVRTSEPRGRRIDNPSRPDDTAAERADRLARLSRQLRADLPLVVPAPFVGLLWVYVAGDGFLAWLSTSVLFAVLALWWAALRGSDPS
ncbi:hypothetical protein [Pseudonocardia acidicola]|uniref:DUF3592 domain-containing protein n=1 Tax=Pseudonocardia acidicola TaxID=2724939 RepID=A0ABX1S688_9PSEU|nr:hypothetical protein [Pseudonocardia acidicola]NMH97090.1 hypothetical protein [Pseudonocardia acidicola]